MHAPVAVHEAAVGYAGNAVLRDIAFTISSGERIAVLGRSGVGKSTLLNLIFSRCMGEAALAPQAAALVRPLSVFHNVFMGRLDRHSALFNLRTLISPGPREKDEIGGMLDLVGLAEKIYERAGSLSGGQQQRTSIARALYNGRPIVIGDEPVSALDRVQGGRMLTTLTCRSETLVLALHDVSLALAHSTRIIVLDAGRIALDAPAGGLSHGDLAPYYDYAP